MDKAGYSASCTPHLSLYKLLNIMNLPSILLLIILGPLEAYPLWHILKLSKENRHCNEEGVDQNTT